jgi:hypothetical protein
MQSPVHMQPFPPSTARLSFTRTRILKCSQPQGKESVSISSMDEKTTETDPRHTRNPVVHKHNRTPVELVTTKRQRTFLLYPLAILA